MKLSRQRKRQACRQLAEIALRALPIKESPAEHKKSLKLLAARMFKDAPDHIAERIIMPGDPEFSTVQHAPRIILP